MKKHVLVAALAASLLTPGLVALAQDATPAPSPVDQKLLDTGKLLYSAVCSQCHQAAGTGTPPTFPALAHNENLGDLGLIAGNIHNGKGAMPAFPNFDSTKIAALATYIRNTWGNDFGGVTAADVDAALASGSSAGGAAAVPQVSVWTGVFTGEQAQRGEQAYSGACKRCHGPKLNGAGQPDMPPSPAVARASFLHKWEGQSTQALFEYLRNQMPQDNPGTLTDQQYADIMAYMFQQSGMPAGDKELPADADALKGFLIKEKAD